MCRSGCRWVWACRTFVMPDRCCPPRQHRSGTFMPGPAGVARRSDVVAGDRAGHAPRPTTARAELGTGDRDHLDAGLLEAGVGLDVALVGDCHAGCDGERVVAVVPLLALGGDRVEPGVDL